MAKTREYMDYLDEKIGIAPANSQEEYKAAETIAELMMDHGLDPIIEEFDTKPLAGAILPIVEIVLFACLLAAGLMQGVVQIVLLIAAIMLAALVLFCHFGTNVLEGFGPSSRSQNVVAVHKASSDKVVKGSRPIVVMAHYDAPRISLLRRGALARVQTPLKVAVIPCVIVSAVALVINLLVFLPQIVRTFVWVIGLIALIPVLFVAVATIIDRHVPCTVGANDNKSSVAAMLTVMDKVCPADDHATQSDQAPRKPRRRAVEEPLPLPAPRRVEVVEEVKGVRHGADVMAALGILPETCQVIYEEPKVRIVEEPVEVEQRVAAEPESELPKAAEAVSNEVPTTRARKAQEDEELAAEDEEILVTAATVHTDEPKKAEKVEEESEPAAAESVLDEEEETDEDSYEEEETYEEDEYEDEYEEDYDYDDAEELDYDEFDDDEYEDEGEGFSGFAAIGSWFKDKFSALRERMSHEDDDEIEIKAGADRRARHSRRDDIDEFLDGEDEDELAEEYEDAEIEDGEYEEYEDEDDDYEYADDDTYETDESEYEYEEDDEEYEDADYEDVVEEADEDLVDDIDRAPTYRMADMLPGFDEDEYDDEPDDVESVAADDFEYDESEYEDEVIESDDEPYEEEAEAEYDEYEMDDEYTEELVEDEAMEDDEPVDEYVEEEEDEEEYDNGEDWYDWDDEEDEEEYEEGAPSASIVDRIKGFFNRFTSAGEEIAEEEFEEDEEYEENSDAEYVEDDEEYVFDGDEYEGEEYEDEGSEYEEYDEDEEEYDYEEEYEDDYEDEGEVAVEPAPKPRAEVVESDVYDAEVVDGELVVEDIDDYEDFGEFDDTEDPYEEDVSAEPFSEALVDPNLLHFDREEDADILPRDDSGLDTFSDSYDLMASEASKPRPVVEPEPIDDPSWGVSSYQPARPNFNIARRAALFDLPDPTFASVDPLSDEEEAYDDGFQYEYDDFEDDFEEDYEPAGGAEPEQADEDTIGTDPAADWKGGATVRSDLRNGDEPIVMEPDELQDAILEMGDDFLLAHDIWFVATGASASGHAGAKAFMDEHRRDIRGAFLINLEAIGAGTLGLYTSEGLSSPRRADRRLVRMIKDIAEDLHIDFASAQLTSDETEAATSMRSRVRSVSIVGLDENDQRALSGTVDDIPDNVNPKQVSKVVRIICELIRRS